MFATTIEKIRIIYKQYKKDVADVANVPTIPEIASMDANEGRFISTKYISIAERMTAHLVMSLCVNALLATLVIVMVIL